MEQAQQHSGADGHVLRTPAWMLAIRIVQLLLSIIVLALAGSIAHDVYLDEVGLALAISIITWLIVAYVVITEKMAACRVAYHIIAVLVLDGLLVVLWLATFAAVAARRAQFVFDVTVDGCYSNGGLFNSKSCSLTKRAVILFKRGGDMMSSIAGLGALLWILFIVTFVWSLVQFLRGRKQGRFPLGAGPTAAGPTETKLKQQQPQQPPAPGPYQQQPPYSPPPQGGGAYAPPQQGQQQPPYGQYAPQPYEPPPPHYPQQYQQPHGSELSAQHTPVSPPFAHSPSPPGH
ncbi:hypothetical protein CDD83_9473 [Cordyceps sp. RAO-2017]|nr:hypothetical protein CDD83_9473 [Cordyceps sp. RAO-2017]